MRTAFLVAGLILCLVGAGAVLYQLSESCEGSALANANWNLPWCSDVLDHVNLTFAGVVAVFVGVMVLALGGPLHWVLEPAREESE